jgi:hypothetical protein
MFVQVSISYSGAGSAHLKIEGPVCLSILLVAVVSGEVTLNIWHN